ncbi:MAG: TIR domain-containing protein [Bacteroidaceae bacterium]|nr:TIR domain-containing protein [Bacteroidaceae bacterium]
MSVIERIRSKVIIKDSNGNDLEQNTSSIVNSIVQLQAQKALVPVIFEDMYEYEDPQTLEVVSLHTHMVEYVISHYCMQGGKLEVNEQELYDILHSGYYGISILESKINKADFRNWIYNSIYNYLNEISDNIRLKGVVRKFLEVGKYPIIITTSCFPLIEKELKGYKDVWFEKGKENNSSITSPTVFHIFGKAEYNKLAWAYNEQMVLDFLKDIYNPETSFKNLRVATDKKTFLLLGNNTPDWLFRFILNSIYGDVYDQREGYYVTSENTIIEEHLNYFLHDIHFKQEKQLTEVLKQSVRVLEQIQIPSMTPSRPHGKRYDLFISYNREDKLLVSSFLKILDSKDINYFFDDNLESGYYWEDIINAIKDSAYFVPFITKKYIKKIIDKEDLQEIYSEMGIDEISYDHMLVRRMCEKISGVQIELLLASKWLQDNPQNKYSLPIILKDQKFNGSIITPEIVDSWGKDSETLPQNLFYGVEAHICDMDDLENHPNIDWKKYKMLL